MSRLLAALLLLFALPAQAVVIDWVTVGAPGNSCDTQTQGCFGSVGSTYQISKFEVTNTQYAEFLNAVAATDPNALYNTSMGSGFGGITRSGSSGSYSYGAIGGREDMPVNYVSFWDATRFANWLHNGQPTGSQDNTTTEDGAYTLTPAGIAGNTVIRNAGAAIFVPSEDEWYKAAYYDIGAMLYYDYPAGSDTQTTCTTPVASMNAANCHNAVVDLTSVGSYTGASGPSGTFDQGGNVWEWSDTIASGGRTLRGGCVNCSPGILSGSVRFLFNPVIEVYDQGIRVARRVPVSFEWLVVGDPGNACDSQPQGCFGSVADAFEIARTEVTNAQYAQFLNAVAAADPNDLYSPSMASGFGGITRSGVSGSYSYSAIAGREELPVNKVSFWDALRFANWLHNGQPAGAQDAGTTEDGAYTLTAPGIASNTIVRNPSAQIVVPTEDEWYKAAYFDTVSSSYFDYPAGSDTQTTCALPGATPNTANCEALTNDLTAVGSYPASMSPIGTLDQGGNVSEWNETIIGVSGRVVRGGGFASNAAELVASETIFPVPPAFEDSDRGFRVARQAAPVPPTVPSHTSAGLALLGVAMALVGLRRLRG